MTVVLAYLAKPRYGGWVTFACHLHRGLTNAGLNPLMVKCGARTETKMRDFGRGIGYQNLDAAALVSLAKRYPTIIVAVDKTHHDVLPALLAAGARIVIHDPTELKPAIRDAVHHCERVVVIRRTMLKHLPQARFLPHPYCRAPQVSHSVPRRGAVALSRLDFDKHTDLIVQANQRLSEPIDIYGFANTMYCHFKLKPLDPTWDRAYRGAFETANLHSAVVLATRYQTVVDMSVIKQDGQGTQYTFLEAIDAGAGLILHGAWAPTGLLAQYAQVVFGPDQLAETVRAAVPPDSALGAHLLAEHDATRLAPEYLLP